MLQKVHPHRKIPFLITVRENFLLAYPVMLSQLGHVVVQVADTAMIGNFLGPVPLATAALANYGIVSLLIFFGIGVSFGITPLVARADGEGDDATISNVLKHGVLINLCIGILLLLVVVVVGRLIHFLDQPEEVTKLAIPYLYIVAASIIPLMIFQSYRQFAEGLSRTRVAMIIVVTSNLVNILLNYALIPGRLGLPAMGLEGAGWATLIARVLMAGGMGLYVYYGRRFVKFRSGFSLGAYTRKMTGRILNIGIPAGMQFIFEGGAFSFSLIMMGWIGAKAVAAHQIAINLATLSYMITSGLGAAATIKVGKHLGQRDFPALRRDGYTLIIMAITLMSFWAALFIMGRGFLAALYIDDPDVIAVASSLLIIAGIFQLSDGTQVVCAGALRGLQDVKVPMALIFVAYWIIGLPLGYGLGFHTTLGPVGIWIGLLAGLTLTAIAMLIRFRGHSTTTALDRIA